TTAGPSKGRSPSGRGVPRGRRAKPVTQSPSNFHGAWGAVTPQTVGLQTWELQGGALGDGVHDTEQEPDAQPESCRRTTGQGRHLSQVLADELVAATDVSRVAGARAGPGR